VEWNELNSRGLSLRLSVRSKAIYNRTRFSLAKINITSSTALLQQFSSFTFLAQLQYLGYPIIIMANILQYKFHQDHAALFSLKNHIGNRQGESEGAHFVTSGFPNKISKLGQQPEDSLNAQGINLGCFTIRVPEVPHGAWDALCANVLTDPRFDIPPRYIRAEPNRTMETLIMPTGLSIGAHIGFNQSHMNKIAGHYTEYGRESTWCVSGALVTNGYCAESPGILLNRTWNDFRPIQQPYVPLSPADQVLSTLPEVERSQPAS